MPPNIELVDPKYCDGCRYLSKGQCVWFLLEPEAQYEGNANSFRMKGYIRPQKCIKERG